MVIGVVDEIRNEESAAENELYIRSHYSTGERDPTQTPKQFPQNPIRVDKPGDSKGGVALLAEAVDAVLLER